MALVSTDKHVELVVHRLTKAAFAELSAAGLIKEDELYMTIDDNSNNAG